MEPQNDGGVCSSLLPNHRLAGPNCEAFNNGKQQRRSANYKPNIWKYEFLQSLSSKVDEQEDQYEARIEKLKREARRVLAETKDFLVKLELIDNIEKVGLGNYFEEEIKESLETILVSFQSNFPYVGDLHATALSFRLLRQHSLEVTQDMFSVFLDETGTFKETKCKEVKGVLELFEASHLAFEGEQILVEAKSYAYGVLKSSCPIIEDSNLKNKVVHALKLPYHWRLQWFDVKWQLNVLENASDVLEPILELAKLNFNVVQATLQKDLREVARWWWNLGLMEKVAFARDRLVESFLCSVGVAFERKYSYLRIWLTKVITVILIIDDAYDVYGSLEEMHCFTNAVNRWDPKEIEGLPECLTTCFEALRSITDEIAHDMQKEKGWGQLEQPQFEKVDERKPLDGSPAPRRTISDESFQALPSRMEVKPESALGGRPSAVNSYLGRVVDGGSLGPGSQSVSGNGAQVRGPANAWGMRKDPVISVDESRQSSWSGRSVESKLAHVSALDKVLSGKWQTKQSLPYRADVEVIDHLGVEKVVGSCVDDEQKLHKVSAKESDIMLARQLERGMAVGEGKPGPRREFADHDGARASSFGQMKERNLPVYPEKAQPAYVDGRLGGRPVSPAMQSEPSERPKLKLLPRSKPLESTEVLVPSNKQAYSGQNDSLHGRIANAQEVLVNGKFGVVGGERENQVVERPKLNLKSRSQQPIDLAEGRSERERTSIFGGACPQEMFLKQQGVDDNAMNNRELSPRGDRVKHNFGKHPVPKTERVGQHAISPHPGERVADSPHISPRMGIKLERKDQAIENERADQRKNWRSENWRNDKDTERQQQRQPVLRERQQQKPVHRERQPSPETWRKHVEPQKPTNHFGKTASALELAQAFSRSVSDPRVSDPYSGHKVLPGTNKVPFSRLIGPGPRSQINGY